MTFRIFLLSYAALLVAFSLPIHAFTLQSCNPLRTHEANRLLDALKNETIESDLPLQLS